MNKFKYLTLVAVVFLTWSCITTPEPTIISNTNDTEPEELILAPASDTLYRGETLKISVQNSTNNYYWTTSDAFVADVNINNGTVTARHIGDTKIKAESTRKEGICNITVIPKYDLYEEPCTEWGATKDRVINLCGEPLLDLDSTILYFDMTKSIIITYIFKDNGLLSGVLVSVGSANTSLGDYLLERYEYYRKEGGYSLYGNSMSITEASFIVALSTESSSSYQVVYMNNPLKYTISSMSSDREGMEKYIQNIQ